MRTFTRELRESAQRTSAAVRPLLPDSPILRRLGERGASEERPPLSVLARIVAELLFAELENQIELRRPASAEIEVRTGAVLPGSGG